MAGTAKKTPEAAPKRKRVAAKVASPRRRRTAEDARNAILDAAEKRLVISGPAGIRLQDVAADVGVSHPTVLHHFGSREHLVREVCRRGFVALLSDLVAATTNSEGGAERLGEILDKAAAALREHGHGRFFFWLALEGLLGNHEGPGMEQVALAAQHLRTRRRGSRGPAPLDDTRHVVALGTLALLAESVVGTRILGELGLGDDAAAERRFRKWLARLLVDHLDNGPR